MAGLRLAARFALPTPRLVGIREGAEDGQYLYTLVRLIEAVRASRDPTRGALAEEAQVFVDGLYAPIRDIAEYERNGPFPHSAANKCITDATFFHRLRPVRRSTLRNCAPAHPEAGPPDRVPRDWRTGDRRGLLSSVSSRMTSRSPINRVALGSLLYS